VEGTATKKKKKASSVRRERQGYVDNVAEAPTENQRHRKRQQ
jgi:hypothetical protein